MHLPEIMSQLRRHAGRLAQLAWLAFAILALGLTLAGLRYRFAELQVICDTPRCIPGQPTVELITSLARQGERVDAAYIRDQISFAIANRSILSIFIFALGGVLIWQKPSNITAALTALVFVALAVMLWGMPESLARANPAYALPVRLLRFLMLAGLLVVFSILPNGQFRWTWLRWLTAFFALACFFFVVGQGATLDMPLAADNALFAVITAIAALVVMASLLFRFRAADTEIARQQLKWILVGTSLAVVWIAMKHVLYVVAPSVMRDSWSNYIDLIDIIVIMSFAGCIAVAILQFQLFDIDIVINRGLVYGALTLFIIAAYALIVGGLSVTFARLAPTDDAIVQILLPLIATSLIVLAFQPLRDRLQRGVNRLMYGERDEPYRVLTRLGQRLEAALEPSAALPLTVETVARALKLPYVAIAHKANLKSKNPDPDRESEIGILGIERYDLDIVAAYGKPQNALVTFPLIYAGETIGELVAASRAPDEPLTEADRRLLSDLARQIGVTAHAILLAADLEHARLRIVATREETRRRLGSDLHDGVGHQLAGLARQLELASHSIEHDPAAARELLKEVSRQLNAAIAQVRGLAHQLHPPELEVLGLAGALRERAQTQNSFAIRLDAPVSLPPLPTAVETAAYYIALEALTNVEKHAGAKSCHIHLALVESDPPVLEMDIADDGRGLSPQTAGGLGLLSMQARAAEVGGLCRIESTSPGGARVSVRLPCPAQLE